MATTEISAHDRERYAHARARGKARAKVWALEGYLLKESLYRGAGGDR